MKRINSDEIKLETFVIVFSPLSPAGLDAKYINCDESCSPDINDFTETYRWFHHVLPQLRDLPVR